ncbi:MAG: TonB-dependent receptor plug domain-containing protein [candidate division WOR-3 bacterium]|nr:MAG: TonB-dependent receptor plug domain-containing protein [candidate division WOR-3 bacterium]
MKRVACTLAVITFFTVFAQDIEDIPAPESVPDTVIAEIDTAGQPIPDFTVWTYTEADINRMPVTTVYDILILQPGIVESEAGLHLRGGGADEIGYYVDGIQTSIPIPLSAIDRLHVMPNPTDAEYGNALAGIVDITTKKLTKRSTGMFRYMNDNPFSDETLDRGYDQYEACFQGLLTPYVSFTVAGNMTNTDAFQQALYKVPSPRDNYTLFGSVTLQVTKDRGYVTFSGVQSREQYVVWTPYTEPGNNLKYFDQRPMSRTKRSLVAVSFDLHPFSKTDFSVNIGINKSEHVFGNRDYLWEDSLGTAWYDDYRLKAEHLIRHLGEDEIPPREIIIDSIMQYHEEWSNRGPEVLRNIPYGSEGLFRGIGDYPKWIYEELHDKHIRLKCIQSFTRWYDVKTGFDYTGYNVKHYANHLPWVTYPFWDLYERSPYTYGAYVHNDIHFGHLVADIGMRYDYLQPDAFTFVNPFIDQDSTILHAEAHQRFSPRMSITAGITQFLSLWIRYGHFFQQASFHHLYSGTDVNVIEGLTGYGFIIGNIFIEPAETHVLELGTSYRHTSGFGITASFYRKRLYHLTSMMCITSIPDYYYQYCDINSGTVIGTQQSIYMPLSPSWLLRFDFGYQQVMVQDQWITWYYEHYGYPIIEPPDTYADHDVQLSLKSYVDFVTPSDISFGLLKNLTASLFLSYQSGLPYPAMDLAGNLTADYNSERMPGYININLKIGKGIHVGPVKLVVTAMIFNLFNSTQIIDVYNTTGLPDDHGNPDPYLGQFGFLPITSDRYSPQADFDHDGLITPYEFRDDYIAARDDYYDDPTNWKNPFRFLLGVGIEF